MYGCNALLGVHHSLFLRIVHMSLCFVGSKVPYLTCEQTKTKAHTKLTHCQKYTKQKGERATSFNQNPNSSEKRET